VKIARGLAKISRNSRLARKNLQKFPTLARKNLQKFPTLAAENRDRENLLNPSLQEIRPGLLA
jgi:pantothenate synthetase